MPYIEVIAKYADFGGRAARLEYWLFQVIHHIIWLALLIPAITVSGWLFIPFGIYGLATFLPRWALSVRRLHDTGRSGWWLLLHLVPFGSFVLFIFYIMGSDGNNEYGPEPR